MTRFFDLLFSSIAIILLFPFMLPIMIALRLTGEHHIFYQQPRMGRNGNEFKVLKFATMLKDSPNMTGGFITQKDDPRVLPMGAFLRKTKINELPQLVNVFLGQMSLVGPRPVVATHLENFPIGAREAIKSMRPGLTGIASLVFCDEEGILDRMTGDRKYNHDCIIAPFKGELELWYKSHRSLRLYFSLLFRTALSVLLHGASRGLPAFKDLPEVPKELEEWI
jgi:lipopolysaccharide/colanic/teichoic acid biosynthesis glycosyltransferase